DVGAHRLGQHDHLVGAEVAAEELDDSMASVTRWSKVMGPLPALPVRRRVLPAPRWSHWTTVNWRSQGRSGGVKTALGQPGPPCRTSRTGVSRSSPRSWIHWSIPPTLTNRCSRIPLGVVIARALATWRWRALRQASPPAIGATVTAAVPARMVPIIATPHFPDRRSTRRIVSSHHVLGYTRDPRPQTPERRPPKPALPPGHPCRHSR